MLEVSLKHVQARSLASPSLRADSVPRLQVLLLSGRSGTIDCREEATLASLEQQIATVLDLTPQHGTWPRPQTYGLILTASDPIVCVCEKPQKL